MGTAFSLIVMIDRWAIRLWRVFLGHVFDRREKSFGIIINAPYMWYNSLRLFWKRQDGIVPSCGIIAIVGYVKIWSVTRPLLHLHTYIVVKSCWLRFAAYIPCHVQKDMWRSHVTAIWYPNYRSLVTLESSENTIYVRTTYFARLDNYPSIVGALWCSAAKPRS